MESLVNALFLVLLVAAPIAGYTRAMRRGCTRGQVLLAATLGGALAGVAFAAYALLAARPGMRTLALLEILLPYVAIFTAWGAAIGLCGLVARAAGAWLSRRP